MQEKMMQLDTFQKFIILTFHSIVEHLQKTCIKQLMQVNTVYIGIRSLSLYWSIRPPTKISGRKPVRP